MNRITLLRSLATLASDKLKDETYNISDEARERLEDLSRYATVDCAYTDGGKIVSELGVSLTIADCAASEEACTTFFSLLPRLSENDQDMAISALNRALK